MGFVHNFQESNSLRPVACRHCKALVSSPLPRLAASPTFPPDLACRPKPHHSVIFRPFGLFETESDVHKENHTLTS